MAGLQSTPFSEHAAAAISRSSNRLWEKSQRRFSLPSRKDVLDSVVPDVKTPFKNYSDYKPRKLINNFVKERNTYNNPDGIDLFDEMSDEEDFINDNSSSDEDSSESKNEEGSSSTTSGSQNNGVIKKQASKPTKKQHNSMLSDNESDGDLARPLKSHKHRLPADASSGSETDDTQEEEFVLAIRRKKLQRRVTIDSDSSSDGDEEQNSHLKSAQDSCSSEEIKILDNGHESGCLPPTSAQDPQVEQKLQDLMYTQNVHARKEAYNETNKVDSAEDSDDSFIATDSSSDDVLDSGNDTDSSLMQSNGPSHEELICILRQKKRPRKNKRRFCRSSSSSSADSQNERSSDCDGKAVDQRPPSKRAERLHTKKLAWKSDVLGSYKNEREKKLMKK